MAKKMKDDFSSGRRVSYSMYDYTLYNNPIFSINYTAIILASVHLAYPK